MSGALKMSATTGHVALYDYAPGDTPALRDRPFTDPASWLPNIKFHSWLDYMEVSHGPTTVNVAHAAVAAAAGAGPNMDFSRTIAFDNVTATHALVTHGLGYADFMVIYDGDVLYPGQIVQFEEDGRCRQVAPYATTTEIRLVEWAVQSGTAIGAVSRDYTVIVFKRPPARANKQLLATGPSVGATELAGRRFRSDRRYLQANRPGSPYGFSRGRTLDLSQGAPRYVSPDGGVVEPIPADYGIRIRFGYQPGGAIGGGALSYAGSFAGSDSVVVGVP